MVMKGKAFKKSTRRAIKSSIARFVSIILISFLGAAVFAGLAATSPNMKRVGDEYYDQQNVMDVRMLSTYGFAEEDVEAIRNTEGVSAILASYTVDAVGSVDDKDYTFRINGLAGTDASASEEINKFKMVDGRLPENGYEAVVIRPSIGLKNIALGSRISLDEGSNDAIPDTLGQLAYTIVGVAESPYYLSFMQGNTAVGSGMIDYVLYVPQADFVVDGYTDIYVAVDGAKELNAFEDQYIDHVSVTVERLDALSGERETLRHDDFQSDLAEAKEEYNDADAEADEKLSDAKTQLNEGETELAEAKERYADGMAEYNAQKASVNQKLADARAQLEQGAAALAAAQEEYGAGLAEYNTQKAEIEQRLTGAEAQLEEGAAALAAAQEEYDAGLAEYNAQKAEIKRQLAGAEAQLEEGAAALAAAQEEYDAGLTEYSTQKAEIERQLAGAEAQLEEGAAALAAAQEEYDAGLAEYSTQKAEIERQLAPYQAELDATAAELAAGEGELAGKKREFAAAEAALEAARSELDLGWADYHDKAAELADGKAALSGKKDQLDAAQAQYDSAAAAAEVSTGMSMREIESALPGMESDLASAKSRRKSVKRLASLKADRDAAEEGTPEYDALNAEYQAALQDAGYSESEAEGLIAQLGEMEAQIDAAQAKYDRLSELVATKHSLAEKWENYNAAAAEIEEGEQQLVQAKQDLESGEAEYAGKSAELETAREQINAAEAELAAGKQAYEAALAEYNAKKAEAEAALAPYEEELERAAAALEAGEAELAQKQQEYEDEKSEAETGLAAAKAELDGAAAEIEAGEAALAQERQEYEGKKAEAETGLAAAKAELDSAAAEIEAGEAELAQKQQEYEGKKTEAETGLAAAKAQLDSAAAEIEAGEAELAQKQQEYEDKRAEAVGKLADAKADLDEAAEMIADAEEELSEKWQEYDDKEQEANTELADALAKITDAEEKLSDLGDPKWYVLDRYMNEAFVTYESDTERMRDLATVFPIVFFLVAALVCLTTMTRMVDEDRTLIGTFLALGYSNARIAGRYLKYAASASLIGSLIGICVGFRLIPAIIWGAYGIVFALPEMTPAFYTDIGFMAVFSTVFITTLSTGIAAKNTLKSIPAELLRPKAPKSGKRVFLEHVQPIWSRLTFSQKVTVRNLGLNKKRLLMSLVGILGCTALVVTAFGAKNAVSAILDDQFGRIFKYNIAVGFNDSEPSAELASRLGDKTYFEKAGIVFQSAAEASLKGNDEDAFNIYVVSPEDSEALMDCIAFTDYETKKVFAFSADSVMITEKLSMNLHVGVGDTILVKYLDKDEKQPVTITGITTNYTFNYVYLGKTAYERAFGASPDYNRFYAIMQNDRTSDEVKAYLSAAPGLGAISFTDDLMGNIRNSIQSVDKIIWVLIIAAGLLAFVVLYNLTNINIGERQRELATLKVLGFYDRETYGYIFRETVTLSIIGSAVGLFAGVFLYRAVVTTVEPDMLLLTRDLTWQAYLGAACLTMFFTWIVNQFMKPRIRNIDMLESLKSVD